MSAGHDDSGCSDNTQFARLLGESDADGLGPGTELPHVQSHALDVDGVASKDARPRRPSVRAQVQARFEWWSHEWLMLAPGERMGMLFACLNVLAFALAVTALVVAAGARAGDSGSGSHCSPHEDSTWGQPVVEFQGHSYQLVSVRGSGGGLTFPAAQADAAARCYRGHAGFLATVESAQENTFLQGLLPAMDPNDYASFASWLGATDTSEEGRWTWQGGPSAGRVFWVGDGDTGVTYKGRYSNWNCDLMDDPIASGGGDDWWAWYAAGDGWDHCEPNDYQNQDCLSMSGDGTWFDVSCYRAAHAFFVEFNTAGGA